MTDTEQTEQIKQADPSIPASPAPLLPPKSKAGRKKGVPNTKIYEFRDRAATCERRKEIMRAYIAEHPEFPSVRHGGRDRGGHHADTVRPEEKRVVLLMLESTRETIKRCAESDGITAIEFMHELAETLRSSGRYVALFAPDTESGQERQTDAQ